MRIYVDEDMAAGILVRLLQKAGHDVESPRGAGMLGRSDPVQLTFAIHESRLCLTANYDDYEELHLLVRPRAILRQRASWPQFANWRRPACPLGMSTSS
jgi:hypothetical protein